MIVIAKNITKKDISFPDLGGYTITNESQEILSDRFNPYQLALSNDLLVKISSGDIVINNGEVDLSISKAVRYISLYKHQNPISTDGKETIRSDSRPPNFQTMFTMIDDSDNNIARGTPIFWDFSNNDEIITNDSTSIVNMPIPNGYKRKRLIRSFNDDIYLKEGAIYFSDAVKGTFLDLFFICPEGEYYYDKDEQLYLAQNEIVVSHYLAHHMIFGTCNFGDELNAEGCQECALPPNYKIYCDITVPESDVSSFGFASIELYRWKTSDDI